MEEVQVKNNNVVDAIKSILDGANTFASTKKVIGEPFTVGDITVIPFIETSMGMGVGAFSPSKEAGGMGCTVSPIACLVIQNGHSKLITIKNQDPINKALDMIPELLDRLTSQAVVLSPEETKEIKKTVVSKKGKKLAK